jgi:hypothetical protein
MSCQELLYPSTGHLHPACSWQATHHYVSGELCTPTKCHRTSQRNVALDCRCDLSQSCCNPLAVHRTGKSIPFKDLIECLLRIYHKEQAQALSMITERYVCRLTPNFASLCLPTNTLVPRLFDCWNVLFEDAPSYSLLEKDPGGSRRGHLHGTHNIAACATACTLVDGDCYPYRPLKCWHVPHRSQHTALTCTGSALTRVIPIMHCRCRKRLILLADTALDLHHPNLWKCLNICARHKQPGIHARHSFVDGRCTG